MGAKGQPAHSIGRLVIGHEVRSFIAEGDTTSYWIIDDSGTLKEEYEKKDPVAVAERQLLEAGWLTPEETAALKKQYADEVQLAVATAQREPEPDPFREDWNATVWRPY